MYVFDWLKLDIINVVKNEKFYHALPVPQYSDCLMMCSKMCYVRFTVFFYFFFFYCTLFGLYQSLDHCLWPFADNVVKFNFLIFLD